MGVIDYKEPSNQQWESALWLALMCAMPGGFLLYWKFATLSTILNRWKAILAAVLGALQKQPVVFIAVLGLLIFTGWLGSLLIAAVSFATLFSKLPKFIEGFKAFWRLVGVGLVLQILSTLVSIGVCAAVFNSTRENGGLALVAGVAWIAIFTWMIMPLFLNRILELERGGLSEGGVFAFVGGFALFTAGLFHGLFTDPIEDLGVPWGDAAGAEAADAAGSVLGGQTEFTEAFHGTGNTPEGMNSSLAFESNPDTTRYTEAMQGSATGSAAVGISSPRYFGMSDPGLQPFLSNGGIVGAEAMQTHGVPTSIPMHDGDLAHRELHTPGSNAPLANDHLSNSSHASIRDADGGGFTRHVSDGNVTHIHQDGSRTEYRTAPEGLETRGLDGQVHEAWKPSADGHMREVGQDGLPTGTSLVSVGERTFLQGSDGTCDLYAQQVGGRIEIRDFSTHAVLRSVPAEVVTPDMFAGLVRNRAA